MGIKFDLTCKILDKLKDYYGLETVSAIMPFMPKWALPLLLSRYGATIGTDVIICMCVKLENTYNGYSNLVIGDKCYIGYETLFDLTGKITIEDSVALAPRCTILTHQDVGERPLAKYYKATKEHTILRRGCWIGAGVIILGGVEIGENAVIAAGSVVTKNVESFSVYAGAPARFIKKIDSHSLENSGD